MGCDRQRNFLFVLIDLLGAEEPSEDRKTTESRHLAGRFTISVADQTCQDLRFAIPQSQHSRSGPRADLIGQTRPGRDFFHNATDFQVQLHGHFIIPIDRRLHIELQPDIEICHTAGHHTAGSADDRRHRVCENRHTVANVNLGLFVIPRSDPRAGEDIDLGVFPFQIDRRSETRHTRVRAIEYEILERLDRRSSCGRDGAEGVEGDLVGELDPDLCQLRARDLHDLHFHHDFRILQIERDKELLGHADHLRRIPHHEQPRMLVDEQGLGVQHHLQQAHRLLGVCVREVEGLDHLLFVAPPFVRRVGIN